MLVAVVNNKVGANSDVYSLYLTLPPVENRRTTPTMQRDIVSSYVIRVGKFSNTFIILLQMWERVFHAITRLYLVALSTELYRNWAAFWMNQRMEGERGVRVQPMGSLLIWR